MTDDVLAADTPVAAPNQPLVLRVVRTIPYTIGASVFMLVLGAATGTLWNGLSSRPMFDHVSYGLPAFQQGQWWTPFTGSPFALVPLQYVAVVGVFLVGVGFCEWRLGTKLAIVLSIGIQVGAVVVAAGLLALLKPTGWHWAVEVAANRDVGWSAGALGSFCAATVTLKSPWRARVRTGIALYAVLLLLYEGLLWDLEHALSVLAGLLLGPLCVGRAPKLKLPRMSRHEWRLAASAIFLVSALVQLIQLLIPDSQAPLHPDAATTANWLSAIFAVAIPLALAEGLRRGRRWAWRIGFTLASIASGLLLITVVAAILVYAGVDGSVRVTGNATAQIVASEVLWVLMFLVLFLGRSAFRGTPRKDRRRATQTAEDDRTLARRTLQTLGGERMSWMTTWPHNRWWFAYQDPAVADLVDQPAIAGYVAYQEHSGIAVALCDPVAVDDAAARRLCGEFVDAMRIAGLEPAFFSVTQNVADWAAGYGWQSVMVAQESVIELPELEFKGKAWQDVRTALNRAAKEGISFRLGALAEMPRGVLVQVRAISEQWVGDKGLPEMGFTLGGVDEALDPDVRVGLAVDGDGTVHGVASWLPVYGHEGTVVGWTLDVIRRLEDGFRPVTEFLIASSCLAFKDEGAAFVSLSGSPLAGKSDREPTAVDRLLSWLGEQLEPLYGFRSLDSFKAKFQPVHEPVYLVYRDEATLPRVGLALTRAYLPDATMMQLASAGLKSRASA